MNKLGLTLCSAEKKNLCEFCSRNLNPEVDDKIEDFKEFLFVTIDRNEGKYIERCEKFIYLKV